MPCFQRRAPWRVAALPAVLLACHVWTAGGLHAQERAADELPAVTIRAPREAEPQVEKSYRRMVRGLDLFERERHLAPAGELRFRLLPRRRDTDLRGLALHVLGARTEIPLAIAPDQTFALPRDQQAWRENALVTPDRRARTLTWRAEVRTPGLPPGTRRLGDLRLECRVGMEAGLVSESPSWIAQVVSQLANASSYCERADNRYLFFAPRALFGVTLVDGARRETLPVARLYAAAIGEPRLADVLPACDCEVLLDRAYFLPLADGRWSDDTRVEFEFMEDAGAPP
ncbi:MAG TPA: hypothetical protein VFE82_09695 [Ramlibacter sp.]|jgi:hypothetical protein|uniref:hypothetical protein n=1 Tax=Ramlibacter sp. TaxID=1917967 RepID=UPI002D4DBB6D|nr:hypothetical protein [Ramlibacter sp.]HZY18745.1 hypothetical protein [Ramlibacter sp.]